jgi:hypothetical protein
MDVKGFQEKGEGGGLWAGRKDSLFDDEQKKNGTW